jgi:hypothetical protein
VGSPRERIQKFLKVHENRHEKHESAEPALLSQSGVNPVGASLLAMAMAQSTRRLKVMALLRAGSLLKFLRC